MEGGGTEDAGGGTEHATRGPSKPQIIYRGKTRGPQMILLRRSRGSQNTCKSPSKKMLQITDLIEKWGVLVPVPQCPSFRSHIITGIEHPMAIHM